MINKRLFIKIIPLLQPVGKNLEPAFFIYKTYPKLDHLFPRNIGLVTANILTDLYKITLLKK